MNLTLILAGLYLYYFHPASEPASELSNMYLWTGATTVGMAFQWAVQMPSLRKLGWSFRLAWPPRHPGVFEMLALMAPAVLSQSAMQFNLLINQFFASFLPSGDLTCLYSGNRLMQLPYGVFGVSIATVVFPLVARHAAAGDRNGIRSTLSRALEASAFITLPCTVGLVLTAAPITLLAFRHGHFNESAAALTTEATILYVLGLAFFSSNKILVPSFYALGKPRWPLASAFASVGADFILNYSSFHFIHDMHLRFLALPAATSLAGLVNFACLTVGLHRYGIRLEWRAMFPEFARILAATVLMGVAAWGTLLGLQRLALPAHLFFEVFLPIAVGAGLYFLLAHALGCRSLDWARSRRGKPGSVAPDAP
jgi:putative peptidoglycan lipid II flippase